MCGGCFNVFPVEENYFFRLRLAEKRIRPRCLEAAGPLPAGLEQQPRIKGIPLDANHRNPAFEVQVFEGSRRKDC